MTHYFMNKKTLFLILLVVILVFPALISAQAEVPPALKKALDNIKVTFQAIGTALVVIGFIVAGILFLTSAGSPEKIGTAKKALIAAVGGGVLVALATGAELIVQIVKEIIGAE